MFIQTEATPNPSTLKFIPNQPVLPAGHGATTEDYASAEDAEASPLAKALFAAGGVARVFFAQDFISITKRDDREWLTLKPVLLGTIMDHFVSNRPVVTPQEPAPSGGCGSGCGCANNNVSSSGSHASGRASGHAGDDAGDDGANGEIIAQIKDLLDTRIRPAVARDGGDVVFLRYCDGVVTLRMRGACAGCPSAQATLKHGIENLLRHFIPEVREVVGG